MITHHPNSISQLAFTQLHGLVANKFAAELPKIKLLVAHLIIGCCLSAQELGQQKGIQSIESESTITKKPENFRKAISIVSDAMTALGGLENTNNIQTLQMEWEGEKYMDGQSRSFNRPLDSLPLQTKFGIDFATDRLFNETAERYLGGYLFHFRTVYSDTTAFNFEVPKIRFSGINALPKEGKISLRQSLLRNLPNYLLKAALDKKQTLRYGGQVKEGGRPLEIVSFAYSPNLVLDLFIDAGTKLLSKYSLYTDHPIHGDQQVIYSFADYKDINGVKFPTERTIAANGYLNRSETLRQVRVNQAIESAYFQKPQGYGAPVSVPTVVKEIGRNIFMVEGLNGYNPLFLNFENHLMFIEAVAGSEKAIELVKKQFPGKPVKYVSFSHYHEDHTVGLPDFIREGSILITSKTNMPYLTHLITAIHSLQSSITPASIKELDVYAFPKTFSDTNVSVTVMPFGRNSHTDDLLVYYFPEARILYQADLLISTDDGRVARPVLPVNKELYDFIIANKLQVDTVHGVHWKPIPFAELKKAVLGKE